KGQLFVDGRVNAMGGCGAEQQRITVGVGTSNRRRSQVATCSRAVVNDDGYTELFFQGTLNTAGNDIDTGTGRKAHDNGDRPLRPCCQGRSAGQGKAGTDSEATGGRKQGGKGGGAQPFHSCRKFWVRK